LFKLKGGWLRFLGYLVVGWKGFFYFVFQKVFQIFFILIYESIGTFVHKMSKPIFSNHNWMKIKLIHLLQFLYIVKAIFHACYSWTWTNVSLSFKRIMFILPFVYWLCVHSHLSTSKQSFMEYKICNVTL
jgi:protein-S-isoprenylcysteine O-methyltransferase Ste14